MVVRLRMRLACERRRGRRLLRVLMRERGDNGPGHLEHIVRALTRVCRKVCSVLTMPAIPQGTLTAKVA
jgi:hypothetical protein